MTVWETIAAKYLQPGETLRGAVPAFTGGGFGRVILGVTERRVLLVKSSYSRFTDRGLLWADDARQVRLVPKVVMTRAPGQGMSGNAYVTLTRADGTKVDLNIRRGFLFLPQSDKHLSTLFSLIHAEN